MTIYGIIDPASGAVVYVGHSADPDARMAGHWKQRHSVQRNKANPGFNQWLSSLLLPPSYRVLAVVPWSQRYTAERQWTLMLARKHPLLNISCGAAPLRRPPLTAEHRAKISRSLLARNRRGERSFPAAAA